MVRRPTGFSRASFSIERCVVDPDAAVATCAVNQVYVSCLSNLGLGGHAKAKLRTRKWHCSLLLRAGFLEAVNSFPPKGLIA